MAPVIVLNHMLQGKPKYFDKIFHLRRFHLRPPEFSLEEGEPTATMKIKPKIIEKRSSSPH